MKIKFQNIYVKWGVTVFLTAVAVILFFFAVYRMDGLVKAFGIIANILTPFVYGLVMAFLTIPLYNLVVEKTKMIRGPNIRGKDRSLTVRRFLASFAVIIVIFGVIAGIAWLIIPQLIASIIDISQTLPGNISKFLEWSQDKFQNIPVLSGSLEQWVSTFGEKFVEWVEKTLVPEYDMIISGISEGIISVFRIAFDFLTGVIICVFFINRKDIFAAQSKKLVLAVFDEDRADSILRGSAFTSKTFIGFINGKLFDSLIIGLLCFVIMSIFGWPYAVLISVIIGLTNIIPFFGPFIGAIPSALLLLTVDPTLCIYFVIFIIILQQFDGNILGPKILGDSTGLASFWVIFAILVGGGLFGFLGMVVGIPTFAVIYAYICHAVNRRLEKKGFSTNLNDYKSLYIFSGKTHRELIRGIRKDKAKEED